MLSEKQGKRVDNYISDYVLFDLETTGISCINDEVVEISALKVRNGKVVDTFSTLVNPGRPIPERASMVNGITDEMVAGSPGFEEVLGKFLDFIEDDVLVGHNIHTFDMKFLQRDAEKYYGKAIGNDYLDTLWIARRYLPELPHHKLTDLAEHYGISIDGDHRALNDCRMNQLVFERLAKEMENPAEAAKSVPKCPKCGNVLRKRSGRYGDFWGCMSYPECRYTRNV